MSATPAPPNDLLDAIAGLRVLRAEPLARLLSEGPTGSWRLTLDDGSTVKGQLLWSPWRSERARCLIAALCHLGVPHVVAWSGRAIVQEWVDGVAPDASAHAAAAGQLLGGIHSTPIPPCAGSGDRWQPNAARTRRHLATLAERDVIDARLEQVAAALLPDAAHCDSDLVVTHGDLAPSNVVVERDSARMVPIDNEACDVAPIGWDLARTWYRWPMSPRARIEFRGAYEQTIDRHAVDDHFLNWLVAVLVDATAYRLAGSAHAELPLQALGTVLRRADAGATPDQVFVNSPEICDDEWL